LGLSNVEFQLADAEALDYPINHFDHILCANTFPWIEDKEATLRLWHRFLKPGGRIGVHTPADTAYVGAVVLRKVFAKYGVSLEASNRIGSIKQCQDLFLNAGFEAVEIKTEQHGSYTNLEKAKARWEGVVVRPSSTSLKVLGNGLSQLSSAQLAQAKSEFDAELESLQTEEGIWDDLTTLYILGRK
jgi:SAM-dependent methyltransferase